MRILRCSFKEEASGMCCSAGKVQLPSFLPLPEPLYSLIMGFHPDHNNFRRSHFADEKQSLVKQLQAMLHHNNPYLKDLKTTLERYTSK